MGNSVTLYLSFDRPQQPYMRKLNFHSLICDSRQDAFPYSLVSSNICFLLSFNINELRLVGDVPCLMGPLAEISNDSPLHNS